MKYLNLFFALCLAMAICSCGKIKDPQFLRLEKMHIVKISLKETVIGFSTTYFNPNNFGVTVKEAQIDLYIDSTYIGKFIQKDETTVTKQAAFSIQLEGVIPWQTALTSNLASKAGKEVFINAKGSVKVGKGGIYISKGIEYKGTHILDMGLIKNPAAAGSFN